MQYPTGFRMRIWRCNCYDANLGTLVSWHASRKAATQTLRTFQEERGDQQRTGPEGIDEVEIPTDKKGLLKWLNAHFNTDNG